jgi:hypothetical protein
LSQRWIKLAIRRRRKKLTNLLSTLDRRVKNLEFRPLDVLSEGEAAALIDLGNVPDVIVSDSAPNQFKRIYKAFFYGSKVTGGKGSRVEIFMEADTGAKKDDIIFVSGINGTSSVNTVISGQHKVEIVDSPPWEDGRAAWRYLPTASESNLAHSLYFSVNIVAPNSWTQKRELQSRRLIDSYRATTTEVTITLNANHKFKVKDIISVDLEVENPLVFGIDGLHIVKAVTSTTITYDLDSPLEEPIDPTSVPSASQRFVYPVVHEFIRDGATWIDSSGATDLVYIWKGLRWLKFNEYVGDDGVAPAPPSNLVAKADTRAANGIQAGTAFVTLTWTAPTKNANGGVLDDLLGYEVWHRYNSSEEWEKGNPLLGDDTTWSKGGFEVPNTVFFQVRAIDSGGLRSVPANVSVTTVPKAATIKPPTPPKVSSYLQTIRVEWDGLQFDGTTPPDTAFEVEVHIGFNSGFSISNSGTFKQGSGTYYGGFVPVPGNYLMINSNDLTSNTEYWFKIVMTDVYGNKQTSAPTAISTGNIPKPVTFELLDVGTLNGQLITGLGIETGQNVNSGFGDQSGLILNTEGLAAYSNSGRRTFYINANDGSIAMTGNISINGFAKLTDIPALPTGLLTVANANLKYATIVTTNGISAVATRADDTVAAITQVTAGVVRISQGKLLNSLNANINAGNTTSIEGGNIRTGSLIANTITSGTFTGPTFQTSSPNSKRVLVSGTTNSIKFFGPNQNNDNPSGVMEGLNDGLSLRGSNSETQARLSISSRSLSFWGGDSSRPFLSLGSAAILDGPEGLSGGGTATKGSILMGSSFVNFQGPRQNFATSRASIRMDAQGEMDFTSNRYRFLSNSFVSMRVLQGVTSNASVVTSASGSLSRSSSDSRLKEKVEDISLGLDLVKLLRPVSFKWKQYEPLDGESPSKKDSEEKIPQLPHFGLIAQEVESAMGDIGVKELTNLVYTYKNNGLIPDLDKEEEIYGLEYTALIPILIKSVQELSNQVTELQSKINTIEGNA